MTGIIIQARTGSKRLPNKMTLPFYENKSMLVILLEKIKQKIIDTPVIVATSTNKEDDCIADIASELGFHTFRGSENNVLERFINAAEQYNLKKIIRICADNPFLDIDYLTILINELNENQDDEYVSFKTKKNIPTIKTHLGLWAEGVKLDALKKIKQKTENEIYLEHVTNFIYEHNDLFKCGFIPIASDFDTDNIRLTVDTLADFKLMQKIYITAKKEAIKNSKELFDLINRHPAWLAIMTNEIYSNKK